MNYNGDNTSAMKKDRAYNRLLCAILQDKPEKIINGYLFDAIGCPDSVAEMNETMNKMLEDARKDSKNYFIHYQSGRPIAVFKRSPLGRKLSKGAFSPNEGETD